jgi:hypothetical protein
MELKWVWARIEKPVYMLGWAHSKQSSQTITLNLVKTGMVCRSKGIDLGTLGIFTDGVLFVNETNESVPMCHVSQIDLTQSL